MPHALISDAKLPHELADNDSVAKVFGTSGRYVSDQACDKRTRMLLLAFGVASFASASAGFLICLSLHRGVVSRPASVTITAALLGFVLLAYRFATRRLNTLDKERLDMQRGAAGENTVARALANFPSEFHVINDLSTPFGNLDHVVIGPTGVFVIDAKNWRGIVTANGRGELLLNGNATDKPLVRQFVGRMMGIRDKVKILAPQIDPYYHALFVFTAARVEAKWGTTSNVNCVRDDQLFDYIVERSFGKRLSKEHVERIAQAFLGLAHMDADFTDRAMPLATVEHRAAPTESLA